MQCPSCEHENPAANRFCGGCGAALARACPSCQHANPPDHRFCGACGASLSPETEETRESKRENPLSYTPKHLADKILQSKSALEGERKQVTVLFADVKGSMELADQLDPEEWHGILDRFFQILTDGVHRFEGTVNQYTGDGIMALFGAPIAHEDHAQRACYAALYLRDSLKPYADALRVERGLNFSVRMGINSGDVVVGRIGDDLRMDYTAQGLTVGLAQRMEALAEPGKAMLSGATIDLVQGYFALRDLGETKVKGVDTPVRVAELEGVGRMRTRLDRSRARGLSKFVGRADEMGRLETALERALAGDGQVVGVMAEAGSGKSRLCYEFLERCRARGIIIRTGTCVPHGAAVPLHPILEFYREIFGVTADDSDVQARQKIAGFIAQIAPEEIESLPQLFDFLRVPDPASPPPDLAPDERLRVVMELLRRLTAARSRREPAVLVFEDLHWIDPDSEAIVEGIVDAAAGTRTLLLVNFRPEYRAPWAGRTHFQQIALRPLAAAAAGELLADWLGPDPSLAGVADLVRERTGGNPFFMEEVVQSQIESGVLVGTRRRFRLDRPIATVVVPASVQSLLAARIDRLAEVVKGLLQAASVIGEEIAEAVLEGVARLEQGVLRDGLRRLVQSEFLYEASLYPVSEYAFKHPLTREVAYASLLRERRSALHVVVAETLETLAGEAADQHAALLAHHWEQAGRMLEAAGWQARAAARWGGNAGEAAFHWRKVIELLAEGCDSAEARALLGQARARLVYAASRSLAPEEEVEALFEVARRELGGADSGELAFLLGSYALVRTGAGLTAEGYALANEAAEMARRLDDTPLLATILGQSCVVFNYIERPEEHARLVDELERLYGADPSLGDQMGFRPLAFARATVLLGLRRIGRGGEMEPLLASLYAAVADSTNGLDQTLFHFCSHFVRARRGDVSGALEHARQASDWSVRSGNEATRTMGHLAMGGALLAAGRLDEALEQLEQAKIVGIDRRLFRPTTVSLGLPLLSTVRRELGDIAGARLAAETGVELSRAMEFSHSEAANQVALAEALVAAGNADEAEAALARATELAEAGSAHDLPPLIEEARAGLARLQGDEAGRERALREAARHHRDNGDEWLASQIEGKL